MQHEWARDGSRAASGQSNHSDFWIGRQTNRVRIPTGPAG
ncbi:hypothetical protein GCM10019059_44350 [Camelimonas fluminis]|nr:hypothetical protein GCM10019059_44350 [Camelimonas fluminis]